MQVMYGGRAPRRREGRKQDEAEEGAKLGCVPRQSPTQPDPMGRALELELHTVLSPP